MFTSVLAFALAQSPAVPVPAGQLPPIPVTQIDDRSRAADLDAPRRVSLAFSEPVPIRDVLLLLVRDTPFSMALDPDVAGTFFGELKEVTLRQAINAVLAPRGLDNDVRGLMIHVFTKRTETRLFDVNVLNVHRAWQRTVAPADGTTFTADSGQPDAIEDIEEGIESLLSPAGRAHVDRRSGLAQVTDYADRLDRIGLYLEAIQIRAARQIHLQGRVLQVVLKDRAAIDWNAVHQKLGLPPMGTAAGIASSDPAAIQEALAAQGEVRVLAAQDVIAMNNEAAVLRASTKDVSLFTLSVIAQIAADGIVQLTVSPSWSEHATTNEADTIARVRDGHTVLVAGFTGTTPGTKSAGGFGALFGAQPTHALHTQLVVLLTPTVVTVAAPAAAAR